MEIIFKTKEKATIYRIVKRFFPRNLVLVLCGIYIVIALSRNVGGAGER